MKCAYTVRRLTAALMAALLLVSLAACSGSDEPEKVKLTNVFKTDPIPVPAGIQNVEQVAIASDYIYFIGRGSNEETGVSTSGLYGMKTDGTEVKLLMDIEGEAGSDPEKNIYRYRYIQSLAADDQGNLWYSENEDYNDYSDSENPIYESKVNIKKTDAQGKELLSLDVKDIDPSREYMYVNMMVFDGAGNLYFAVENTLYILDGTSGKMKVKLEGQEYINSLVRTASGDIYASAWGQEGGLVFKKVDAAAKAWGEPIEIKNNSMYNLLPGSGEYDFFYQDSTAVYGYKMATMESVEVLNWINSDINSDRMNRVVPLGDGRMIAFQYPEQEEDPALLMLTRRDPSEIPETIVLTYAAMWLNWDVRTAIIRFNRSQEEYRIQVKDYYQYSTNENYMGGYEKLNMDIITGNVPDIISLEGLNVDNFINKGLLADIYKFIDEDPELKREDFLPNVLEALSRDGKLYQIVPTFNIFTVAGKTSVVGPDSGWTMSDLMGIMNTMPEQTVAFSEMTRGNILSYSTMMAMDQFIDSKTGKCSFDSEAFIQLLEFANQFEEEIDWEALYGEDYDWEAQQNAYKDNLVLLMPCYVSDVRAVREYRDQFGEDITFIGFPTSNKNGTSIGPIMQMGLSAKSKHLEGAWQFLRTFLTAEYTQGSNRNSYGLSLRKDALEQRLALEKTPLDDRPEEEGGLGGGGVIVGRNYATLDSTKPIAVGEEGGDPWRENYHLTEAEADQIWKLITSVNTLMYNDQEISTILNEEVEAYFEGSKTAQETAQIIQNKIQTYISESR